MKNTSGNGRAKQSNQGHVYWRGNTISFWNSSLQLDNKKSNETKLIHVLGIPVWLIPLIVEQWNPNLNRLLRFNCMLRFGLSVIDQLHHKVVNYHRNDNTNQFQDNPHTFMNTKNGEQHMKNTSSDRKWLLRIVIPRCNTSNVPFDRNNPEEWKNWKLKCCNTKLMWSSSIVKYERWNGQCWNRNRTNRNKR